MQCRGPGLYEGLLTVATFAFTSEIVHHHSFVQASHASMHVSEARRTHTTCFGSLPFDFCMGGHCMGGQSMLVTGRPCEAEGQGCARDCTLAPLSTPGARSIIISCTVAESTTMCARACTSRQSLQTASSALR